MKAGIVGMGGVAGDGCEDTGVRGYEDGGVVGWYTHDILTLRIHVGSLPDRPELEDEALPAIDG